jgi:hypothetical protein
VPNEPKDYGVAQKLSNLFIKTNISKRKITNVEDSLIIGELAIEKKIEERKKMMHKLGEYELKLNTNNDSIIDII